MLLTLETTAKELADMLANPTSDFTVTQKEFFDLIVELDRRQECYEFTASLVEHFKSELEKEGGAEKQLTDIVKALSKEGVETTIFYDKERGQFYIDLNTGAKSHLYLYENGVLRGRYDYEVELDLSEPIDTIMVQLCCEFSTATCGKDYYNGDWSKICEKIGVTL